MFWVGLDESTKNYQTLIFKVNFLCQNQFSHFNFFLLKLGGANTNVEDMGFSIKDNKKKIDNFNLKFLNNELKKLFLQ
jgi:hypothetical protein